MFAAITRIIIECPTLQTLQSGTLRPELTGTLAQTPRVGGDGHSGTDGPTEAVTACSSTDGDRGRTARDRLSDVRSAGIVSARNRNDNNLTS